MKLFRLIIALCILTLSFYTIAFAASKTNSKPLTSVATSAIGDVKSGGEIVLPIITWGADIATILANGGLKTQKGSIFDKLGLNIRLVREDSVVKQINMYRSGESPFFRGTFGMEQMAHDALSSTPNIAPVATYILSYSQGGDVLVVRSNKVKSVSDLKGKTVVLQEYGPHVQWLAKMVQDAGIKLSDINIKYVPDLTGTENSPIEVFSKDTTIDAAFCISPDAESILPSATKPGETIPFAKSLVTTSQANTIISDLYFVRKDFFDKNADAVKKITIGLLQAEEKMRDIMKNPKSGEYSSIMSLASTILLDLPVDKGGASVAGMYGDCKMLGWDGNVSFFDDEKNIRGFANTLAELQPAIIELGLKKAVGPLAIASWDFNSMKSGLRFTNAKPKDRSNISASVSSELNARAKTGSTNAFLSFPVYFGAKQDIFDASTYEGDFKKALTWYLTYTGAVLSCSGNVDGYKYWNEKKKGSNDLILREIQQAQLNQALKRAMAVRTAFIEYASRNGVEIRPEQIAVVSYGMSKPHKECSMGFGNYCYPSNAEEWAQDSNKDRRVLFELIEVVSESDSFNG